ncbi:transketolase C-terminal domain-containing protein [Glycomyces salinus]|uniref:transketolase C-terminal domain-containing protein n=1 Tax=Glycomyces salinus TaxID=980294 RepID=UPI0018EB149D|nr:transketolase C-terminal domain-containing protein [Glycomyces salinus]
MREQIEGSQAVARTVASCRPDVVCAYPISPQTHIVEALAVLARTGKLGAAQFVNVESEMAALSVAIGASATGARTYTATASQGLLFMAEALYNAAGLGLPIVMTVANRAIGAPINIWNDHSDSISQRDSGWIQLYALDNQHAADLHPVAYRLAEEVSVPVMVCVDGFVLTHAVEPVDLAEPERVDAFLPPFRPRQVLDPADPVTIGAMVGPEAYTEVRYLAHTNAKRALERLPVLAADYAARVDRSVPAIADAYRAVGAETLVIAMGSVVGTLEDTVDELRGEGVGVGALGLVAFRPFPVDVIRAAVAGRERVVVLERAQPTGSTGVIGTEIRAAVPGGPPIHSVVAGLGGRPVTRASLKAVIEAANRGELPELSFMDLDTGLIEAAGSRP